jgi:hypothetical protein
MLQTEERQEARMWYRDAGRGRAGHEGRRISVLRVGRDNLGAIRGRSCGARCPKRGRVL